MSAFAAIFRNLLIMTVTVLVCGCSGNDRTQVPGEASPAKTADQAGGGLPSPDSQAPAPPVSPESHAGNRPPHISSVSIAPHPAFPGDKLRVTVKADDPEGDSIFLEYRWARNGVPLSGEVMEELNTADFRKGDLITVEVIPADRQSNGKEFTSMPVLLHNRPPEIVSFPAATREGKFVYEVKARDPDEDRLEFSVTEAPAGMTIDAATGLLVWQPPEPWTKAESVRVVVSDGDAKAFQQFSLAPQN